MRKVFISYSRKDGELVDNIVVKPEKTGLDVWLDQEAIRAGNTALITDEDECAKPSHGRVFLAHRDGYMGPSEIPWPE